MYFVTLLGSGAYSAYRKALSATNALTFVVSAGRLGYAHEIRDALGRIVTLQQLRKAAGK